MEQALAGYRTDNYRVWKLQGDNIDWKEVARKLAYDNLTSCGLIHYHLNSLKGHLK